MNCAIRFTLILTCCWAAVTASAPMLACCQEDSSAASPDESGTQEEQASKPPEVEVIFRDGSVVRMAIEPGTNIDIETAYGRLTIPLVDLRRLRLQPRLSEAEQKKIETAIAELADKSFDVRKAAVGRLQSMGLRAMPAMQAARQSNDPEVRQRVNEVLEEMEKRIPAEDLELASSDKLETENLQTGGTVVTRSFPGRSKILGEVEVRLAQVYSLRSMTSPDKLTLEIDSAVYADQTKWLETPVEIGMLDTLRITASGRVDLDPINDPGGDVCSPAGKNVHDVGGNLFPGTLVGRIGPSGQEFVIGERYSEMPYATGQLYLRIGASPYDRCAGEYKVKIDIDRAGDE